MPWLQRSWGQQLCRGCAGVSPEEPGQQSDVLLGAQCWEESLARQGCWGALRSQAMW